MKRTIAFHSNQLSITGTEVALFDYARNNEEVLGNNSFIIFDGKSRQTQEVARKKFSDRFEIIAYEDRRDIDSILKANGADLLYAIKSGKRDGLVSMSIPTMVHAVFPTNPLQAHGASYAYISEWLSEACSNDKIPCVPHIVEVPEAHGDLREALGIPATAKVFGSYGGRLSFDVPAARRAVREALDSLIDVYFIFLNIEEFISHPRAIFMPGSTDIDYKVRFINTCDAMLHARLQGESFGLACGEFSVKNKPILTYKHNKHVHHHRVLGERGFYYGDWRELFDMIAAMDPVRLSQEDWDCYSARYNRHVVMEQFDSRLIYRALKNKRLDRPDLSLGLLDVLPFMRLKMRMAFLSLSGF